MNGSKLIYVFFHVYICYLMLYTDMWLVKFYVYEVYVEIQWKSH
jgi:hypothetical protein